MSLKCKEHNYQLLRTEHSSEVVEDKYTYETRRVYVTEDFFYCTKCLKTDSVKSYKEGL